MDPFVAMAATKHARETNIVTEKIRESRVALWFMDRAGRAYARFLPNPFAHEPWGMWWSRTPQIVRRFVNVPGFPEAKTTYLNIEGREKRESLFTAVGHR